MASASVETFERHRAFLTGLAYRMLGSLADAQDAVQDAYLRWHDAPRAEVTEPRAYLAKVVTRLCLDAVKSARARRETYVGPWLPEPIVELIDRPESLSPEDRIDAPLALMLALERLSPLERAAFLLHDVFEMDFPDVAEALNRNEATCRQLAARARAHVRSEDRHVAIDRQEAARIATAFFAASRSGNVSALRELLAEGAIFHSDGGGHRYAARNIIAGAARILRFFAGIADKARAAGLPRPPCRLARINGLPGIVSLEPDGMVQTTALRIENGLITAIYVVRNPDKLKTVAEIALLPAAV